MKGRKYPEYRPSNSDWFDTIPSHWESLPCRAVVRARDERNEGIKSSEYLSVMANVGVLRYEDKGDVGNKKPEDLSKCKLVRVGDLVINSMNFGIGSYGISAYDGICSPVYIVLESIPGIIENGFAFRIFENRVFQSFAQSFGNGILEHRCAINWDILKTIRVPVPPQVEQLAILKFLDQETSKIDALISEQQRLIELLKEKRQAVISHAVTKGLNPDVRMKPSGIEWLGEVPEHWEVKKLKRVSPFMSVGIVVNPSSFVCESDDGLPFIYGGDIREGQIDYLNSRRISSAASRTEEKTMLQEGDLLTVRVGAPGVTAVVPKECDGGNCASVMLMRKGAFNSDWLCYVMNARLVRFQVEIVQYGAAQQQFNISHAVNFLIPVPPRAEQDSLVAALDAQLDGFNRLQVEAEKAIGLLQERRTALISAAVTGKIDVRNYAVSHKDAA